MVSTSVIAYIIEALVTSPVDSGSTSGEEADKKTVSAPKSKKEVKNKKLPVKTPPAGNAGGGCRRETARTARTIS